MAILPPRLPPTSSSPAPARSLPYPPASRPDLSAPKSDCGGCSGAQCAGGGVPRFSGAEEVRIGSLLFNFFVSGRRHFVAAARNRFQESKLLLLRSLVGTVGIGESARGMMCLPFPCTLVVSGSRAREETPSIFSPSSRIGFQFQPPGAHRLLLLCLWNLATADLFFGRACIEFLTF